jgi:hypothetical protein
MCNVFCILAILFVEQLPPLPEPFQYLNLPGDLNFDNVVDQKDFNFVRSPNDRMAVKQHIGWGLAVKDTTGGDPYRCQPILGDLNGDCGVNEHDLNWIDPPRPGDELYDRENKFLQHWYDELAWLEGGKGALYWQEVLGGLSKPIRPVLTHSWNVSGWTPVAIPVRGSVPEPSSMLLFLGMFLLWRVINDK